MLSILWIAGMICGFLFPGFLIRAIRTKDEENEAPKNTLLASITFGICVVAILVITAYS